MPRALGDLGLPRAEFDRHIAWDIGAGGVAAELARLLDAPLVMQPYSRLAIDCNRAPGHPTSIPTLSEATEIPGNQGLTQAERRVREVAILHPYHATIASLLDARAGGRTLFISVHSFTPVFLGEPRPWQAGVLFHLAPRFGLALARRLRDESLLVGENEPYRMTATSDYTVPFHAERRGLDYVELEIRQDLIATRGTQHQWAARLARLLPQAAATLAE